MNYLTLGIYIFVSIVHLLMFHTKSKRLITTTKALLMPVLTIFYITSTPDVNIFILLALFFGWLGDVFLTGMSQIKFFIFGVIFFLLGHLMYAFVFWSYITEINYLAVTVTLIIICAGSYIMFSLIKNSLGKMKTACIAYIVTISLMFFSACLFLFSNFNAAGIFVITGSLSFCISDSLIGIKEFKSGFKNDDFIIMSTYILAQLLIICGLIIV